MSEWGGQPVPAAGADASAGEAQWQREEKVGMKKLHAVKLSVVSHPVICIVSIKVVLSKGVITR